MLGDRIWHPLVLWDQPALLLCAAAARLLAALLTQRNLGAADCLDAVAAQSARLGQWCAVCPQSAGFASERAMVRG
jgi:hypothetical protein